MFRVRLHRQDSTAVVCRTETHYEAELPVGVTRFLRVAQISVTVENGGAGQPPRLQDVMKYLVRDPGNGKTDVLRVLRVLWNL